MARIYSRIILLALIAVMTGLSSLGETAAYAQEMCWNSDALVGARGEGRIRKSIRKAFVALPEGVPSYGPPVSADARRVIRRVKLPDGQKLVALTFDLCEQPNEVAGYQADIVEFLRKKKIRATFFIGGKWMLTHRLRAEQLMTDDLFEIGNHSWGHRNLRLLSGRKLAEEIDGAALAYQQVRGDLVSSQCVVPGATKSVSELAPPGMGLFRFPYGACDREALHALWRRGLAAVQWDVSSGDPWPGIKPDRMARSVVRRVKPGSIVLFHANGRGYGTGKALPRIVRDLREQGYQFVTVSELLAAGTPEYSAVKHGCYDARPGDTIKYDKFAARLERWYGRSQRRVLGKKPLPPAVRRRAADSSVAAPPNSGVDANSLEADAGIEPGFGAGD
ncbi:MAG: polysaccharide deacetylase family protein [Filomicrobium sp.]